MRSIEEKMPVKLRRTQFVPISMENKRTTIDGVLPSKTGIRLTLDVRTWVLYKTYILPMVIICQNFQNPLMDK